MNGDFVHVSSTQIRLLKEQIAAKFKPGSKSVPLLYSYDEAIDRFKLALFSAIDVYKRQVKVITGLYKVGC